MFGRIAATCMTCQPWPAPRRPSTRRWTGPAPSPCGSWSPLWVPTVRGVGGTHPAGHEHERHREPGNAGPERIAGRLRLQVIDGWRWTRRLGRPSRSRGAAAAGSSSRSRWPRTASTRTTHPRLRGVRAGGRQTRGPPILIMQTRFPAPRGPGGMGLEAGPGPRAGGMGLWRLPVRRESARIQRDSGW